MSNYLMNKNVAISKHVRPRWALAAGALVLAMAVFCTMFIPLLLSPASAERSVQAHAFAEVFCGTDMGTGMADKRGGSLEDHGFADARHRKWTLQEAYGSGVNVVSFKGTGAGEWIVPKELDEGIEKRLNIAPVQARFEEARSVYGCTIGAAAASVATVQFKIASALIGFTNTVVSAAVGADFICSKHGETGCMRSSTF